MHWLLGLQLDAASYDTHNSPGLNGLAATTSYPVLNFSQSVQPGDHCLRLDLQFHQSFRECSDDIRQSQAPRHLQRVYGREARRDIFRLQ